MALERQSRIINQGFFLSPLLNAKYDYDDGVVKGLLHNKYWVTKTWALLFSWASLAHSEMM